MTALIDGAGCVVMLVVLGRIFLAELTGHGVFNYEREDHDG